MAGFIAALMSQIDSTLNAASTLVTMDFVKRWKPSLDSQHLMKVGRWVTGIFMILAALWAPMIENFASLFKYLQMVLSYTVPSIVTIYLVGAFWKGANANGAWMTVLVGTAAGAALFLCNEVLALTQLHFLYVGPILFVLSLITLLIASRFGAPAHAEQTALVWTPEFYKRESLELREQPLWQNYRLWSLALLIVTGALVYLFA